MPAEPVPAGMGAATKQGLLDLVDYAAGRGWPVSKTCEVLGLSEPPPVLQTPPGQWEKAG